MDRIRRCSTARGALHVLVLGAALAGIAGCGSNDRVDSPANRGPNSTLSDPGPNTTAADPGPNPTDATLKTISGTFTVVQRTCARMVLDGSTDAVALQFPRDIVVATTGLTRDGALVAAPHARIFVTGRYGRGNGKCGKAFTVTTLNSAHNP